MNSRCALMNTPTVSSTTKRKEGTATKPNSVYAEQINEKLQPHLVTKKYGKLWIMETVRHFQVALILACASVQVPAIAGYPSSQLKVFSKEKNPHFYLAQKYSDEKKYDKAKTEYSILIAADPTNVIYLISRGQVEISLKDFNGALADGEKILTLTTDPFKRYLASELKAQAYAGLNRTSDAIAEYTEALKNNSTRPEAQYDLGKLLYKSKRYDESLTRLKLALSQFERMPKNRANDRVKETSQLISKIEKIQSKSKSKSNGDTQVD